MDNPKHTDAMPTDEHLSFGIRFELERARNLARGFADSLAKIELFRQMKSGELDGLTSGERQERRDLASKQYAETFERLAAAEFTSIMTFEPGDDRATAFGDRPTMNVSAAVVYGLDEDRADLLRQALLARRDRLVEDAYKAREQEQGIAKLANALGLSGADDEDE